MADDSTGKNVLNGLLRSLRESPKILPENRQWILDFYDVKLGSGTIKPLSLYYTLKPLVRLGESFPKSFKGISEPELARFFNSVQPESKYFRVNGVKRVQKNVGGYSPSSILQQKIAVKSFYRWLFQNDSGIVRDKHGNPMVVAWIKGSPLTVKHKFEKNALSREEVKRMIDCASNARDRAMVAVLFETGVRVSEFLGMRKNCMVLNKDWAEITVDGKTGERMVLVIKSYPYLLDWVTELEELDQKWDFLWIKPDSKKRLQSQSVLLIIKKLARKAGFDKRVYTHALRISSATDKSLQGWNEEELRLQHGWTKGSSMPGTYVNYRKDDFKKKILKNAGIITDENKDLEKEVFEYRECPFCSVKNPKINEHCFQCKKPLKMELVLEQVNLREENKGLKEVVATLQNLTASMNDRINRLETEKVRVAQAGY
jgi:site-specific recombinase XerD